MTHSSSEYSYTCSSDNNECILEKAIDLGDSEGLTVTAANEHTVNEDGFVQGEPDFEGLTVTKGKNIIKQDPAIYKF